MMAHLYLRKKKMLAIFAIVLNTELPIGYQFFIFPLYYRIIVSGCLVRITDRFFFLSAIQHHYFNDE